MYLGLLTAFGVFFTLFLPRLSFVLVLARYLRFRQNYRTMAGLLVLVGLSARMVR